MSVQISLPSRVNESRPPLSSGERQGEGCSRKAHAIAGLLATLVILLTQSLHAETTAATWRPGSFWYIERDYPEFAPFETTTVRVGNSNIDIYLSSASPIDRAMVLGWVNKAATAVASYYGHFPVRHLDLALIPKGRRGIHYGETFGGRLIRVEYGPDTTQRSFDSDWILTHEMFHTAFPDLDDTHLWMTEGMAVYLEPIARARVGNLTPEQVWRGVVRGMPNGLPLDDDQGLDNTHTWGRTYWGGTLFWMLADVEIRKQTDNRRSIDDAMRAILAAGGNGATHWPIERVITAADNATKTHVVRDLYDRMAHKREETDLTALWKSLGITSERWQTTFDAAAPLAEIRVSITAPSSSSPVTRP